MTEVSPTGRERRPPPTERRTRAFDAARSAFADQVRHRFDTELRTLSPSRREDTVAAIAALTSVESWEQFRRSHDRSPTQTRKAWSSAIDRILPET